MRRVNTGIVEFFVVLVLFFSNIAFSQDNISSKYLILNYGISIPFYGHFGDKDIGFKPASGFNAGYVKDIDDVVSIGFITSYYQYYKNRDIDIKIRIFSFTPVIFSWLGLTERNYYVYIGPGIYHWSQPKNINFDSSSSTEAGLRFGMGLSKKLFKKFNWGGNIEWNHIFNMKGKNFDMGSGNTISFSISIVRYY